MNEENIVEAQEKNPEFVENHPPQDNTDVKDSEESNSILEPVHEKEKETIIAVEHCYSKSALEEVQDVLEDEHKNKHNVDLILEESLTLDRELDSSNKQEDIVINKIDLIGGFVSSMIEVVDEIENNTVSLDDEGSDSSSDSESYVSDTDSTSSVSSLEKSDAHRDVELAEEIAALRNPAPTSVTGGLLPRELAKVEDLNVVLPDETVLEPIGKVSQIISDNMVVIKSYEGKPALDCDTVLFFDRNLAIGLVEEIFGPVPSPFYAVLFNGSQHIKSKQVEIDKEVFYAPYITQFTTYVFVSELKRIKGSDASWTNDQEPPPGCLDYSDDEQERKARKQKKNKNESENQVVGSNSLDNRKGFGRVEERGRGRGTKRKRWHNNRIKMNNPDSFDESQAGWQAAVSNSSFRPSNSQQRFGNPAYFPQPNYPALPSLFNCFQTPPPPLPPQFPNFGYQMANFPPPPPIGNFPLQFSQNYEGMQASQNQHTTDYSFTNDVNHFAQPPPPPPPDG